MRILIANLRQFYQRWAVLLFYGVFEVVACLTAVDILFDAQMQPGGFVGLLVPIFPIGLLVGAMQMEVLSTSFSFCLPGHRGVIRRLVLVIGLTASFVFSLPFIGYPGLFDMPAVSWALALCSVFCTNLTVYMVGVFFGFGLRDAIVLMPVALMLVVQVLIVVLLCLNIHFGGVVANSMSLAGTVVERAIVQSSLVIIPVAAGVATVGWWWLGSREWFRGSCGRYNRTDLLNRWSRLQTQGYRQFLTAQQFTKDTSPAIDRVFLRSMASYGVSDWRKYVWGALYPACATMVLHWKRLGFLVWLGLIPSDDTSTIAFFVGIVPVVMVSSFEPPLCSPVLVTGGRKERFFATVALMLAFGAAFVCVVGFAIALAYLSAPSVFGRPHWRLISPLMLLVPLAVSPLVNLMKILFHRKPLWFGLSIGLMYVVFAYVMSSEQPVVIRPVMGSVGIVLIWAICLVAVHRFAMRSDLVRR